MSPTKGKATDSHGNVNKSTVISFWSKLGNVGVLSSTDKEFTEALKAWARVNGYRIEQSRDGSDSELTE